MRLTRGRRTSVTARAIVGVALIALALAACSGGNSNSASSNSAKEGGTITIGTLKAPDTFDPAVGTSGFDYQYMYLIYDRLINLDPKTGALLPDLATSWKYTDASKLTFQLNLRHGVEFQDGTPFNAAAVKDWLEYFKANGTAQGVFPVASIATPDNYTVVLTLSQPASNIADILADRAGMIPSPTAMKKEGSNYGAHPVGAGPYEFTSQVPNASVTLTRFNGYWGGKPKLDGVTFEIFQSSTAMISAVTSGTVQVSTGSSTADLPTLKGIPNVTVSEGPSLAFNLVEFNASQAPTNNQLVREAFNYALNRDAINEVETNGNGFVSWEPFPTSYSFYDAADAPTWPYDPAKAKQLMAQAGLGGGVSMKCLVGTDFGLSAMEPLLVSEEAAVGIHVTLAEGEANVLGAAFNTKDAAPCFVAAWSGRPSAEQTLSAVFQRPTLESSTGEKGGTATDTPGLDSLIAQLSSTYDPSAQKGIIAQMIKKMTTTAPYAPLFSTPQIVTLAKNVGGYVPSFEGQENFANLYYSG
jgi:peptide/nickel transport system substrate-binding protein